MDVVNAERHLIFLFSLTFFLVLFKGIFGFLTSSPVLFADAIHSFSDLIPYLALFLLVRVINRKDERFPYGYYKFESFMTFLLSIFLFYTSIEILKISTTELTTIPLPAAAVEIFSAVISWIMANYQIKIGRETKLKSIEIVGQEKFADALISLSGAFVIFLSPKIRVLQHIFVIFVSLLIIKTALEGFKESLISLLDMNPSGEIYARVKELASKEGRVLDLRIRKAGPCFFVEIKIALPALNLREFEKIKKRIEKEARKIEGVCEVFISPEVKMEKVIVAIPKDGKEVANSFSSAKEFLIVEINGKEKRKIIKNPFIKKKIRKGAAVAKFLLENGVNTVVAREIGFIAYNTLKSKGVVILKGEGEMEEVLEKLKQRKLEEIEEPTRVRI